MKHPLLILSLLALFSAVPVLAEGSAEATDNKRVQEMLNTFGPEWIEGKDKSGWGSWGLNGIGSKIGQFFGGSPTGASAAVSKDAIMPPLWLPMCFLFDSGVDAGIANKKISDMAAAYAACGIALVPNAFTIRPNYPNDYQTVLGKALLSCPVNSAYGVRGAIQIESRFADMPKQMCRNGNADGCSTLCNPLSISFVKPNSGSAVGIHESMHSNCCGPVCVDSGEGRGKNAGMNLEVAGWTPRNARKRYYAAPQRVQKGPITPEGCEALRAGAARNHFVHWYDPARKEYYRAETNPARQADLMAGLSLLPNEEATQHMRPFGPVLFAPTVKELLELPLPPEPPAVTDTVVPKAPDEEDEIMEASKSRTPASVADMPLLSDGKARNRGEGLRRRGSAIRKSNGSDIGFIDAYGGESSGTGESPALPE